MNRKQKNEYLKSIAAGKNNKLSEEVRIWEDIGAGKFKCHLENLVCDESEISNSISGKRVSNILLKSTGNTASTITEDNGNINF